MRTSPLDLTGLSARNRRVFEFGIRGGDGDAPTVEELLASAGDVSALDDEQLATLVANLKAAGKEMLAGELSDDVIAKATEVKEAVAALKTETATREAAASALADTAAALAAELSDEGDEGSEGEGEGEGAEGEGDGTGEGEGEGSGEGEGEGEGEGAAGDGDAGGEAETPEKIAAAAKLAAAGKKPVVSRVAARRPDVAKPRPKHSGPEMRLVASANSGLPGQVLDTPDKIIAAMEPVIRASVGYRGPKQNVPIFSLGTFNPEEVFGAERTLGRDAIANASKIDAVISPKALRASGGICAPVPVQYDLPVIGVDDRPVRDALARFGATRGGVRLLPPPSRSDVTGGIGIWTEANDQDPGSDGPVVKPCVVLDCPDEVETIVAAITQCMTVGNFRARFFPEQVEAWTKLLGVEFASTADTRLLQKIGDLSTQVVATQVLGTVRTVLATLDRATAGLRNHFRMSPSAPVRLLLPAWLLNNMITDLAREIPGATAERLATSQAQIEGFFTVRNVNVTWFLDGESGQTFPLQVDGDLNGWPGHVVGYMYLEGTWLHLDAGVLDFGIVRDSVLNATNDFQMFSEGFEEAAFHGTAGTSYRLAIDICPSGETASTADTSGICLGGS